MAIVTYHYRPKRAPRRKRKQPPIASVIVTPPKLRPLKGPVIRLGASQEKLEMAATSKPQPRRSAIVEPKRKPRPSIFGRRPMMTLKRTYAPASVPKSCGASWCGPAGDGKG